MALPQNVLDLINAWIGAEAVGAESDVRFTLELTLYDVSGAPALVNLYAATGLYTTQPGDTPASTNFEPRLSAPDVGVSLLDGGGVGSRGARNFGVLTLANADGFFDSYLKPADYAWEGHPATLKVGHASWPYVNPGSGDYFYPLAPGAIKGMAFNERTVSLTIAAPLAAFDEPVAELYSDTVETLDDHLGTAIDDQSSEDITLTEFPEVLAASLEGRYQPTCLGLVNNMAPVLINHDYITDDHTGSLAHYGRYQFNAAALSYGALKGWDGGSEMVQDVDFYLSEDVTGGAGHYTGYVDVVSVPFRDFTLRVQGAMDSGVWANQVGEAVAYVLETMAGLSSSEYDSTALAAYDTEMAHATAGDYTPGYEITGQALGEILDDLMAPRGWWAPSLEGDELTFGFLSDPAAGSSVGSIGPEHIIGMARTDLEPVAWQVVMRFARNFKTVSAFNDIANAYTKAWMEQEWSNVSVDDSALLTPHPTARTLEVESPWHYRNRAGDEEPTALLDLHSVRRDVFEARLSCLPFPVWLGDIVTLSYDRFELEAGKKFFVAGLRFQPSAPAWNLYLWG